MSAFAHTSAKCGTGTWMREKWGASQSCASCSTSSQPKLWQESWEAFEVVLVEKLSRATQDECIAVNRESSTSCWDPYWLGYSYIGYIVFLHTGRPIWFTQSQYRHLSIIKKKTNILTPKYLRFSSQLLAAVQFTPLFSFSSRLKGHGWTCWSKPWQGS